MEAQHLGHLKGEEGGMKKGKEVRKGRFCSSLAV